MLPFTCIMVPPQLRQNPDICMCVCVPPPAPPSCQCSTHVEILGNEPMLLDLLHIAAGKHEDIKDSILTKIEDIASKIPWDEL